MENYGHVAQHRQEFPEEILVGAFCCRDTAFWRYVMKDIKLHEGELNVMELLWSNKELAAKDITKIIKEYIGWEKNTTYTVINRLIGKGAIIRQDPGFICKANISKKIVRATETQILLDKFYNGSVSNFITDYLAGQELSDTDLVNLEKIIANSHREIDKRKKGIYTKE